MTQLFPDKRPASAPYATADDWLTCVDLPEADVCLPIAPRRGVMLWIRYRALSMAEQQAAWRAARAALLRFHQEQKLPPPGPDESDFGTLVLETLQRGVVSPHLTPEQAQALRNKNPHILQMVYRLIRDASLFTPEGLEDVVSQLVRERTSTGETLAPADDGSGNDGALGPGDRGDA